MSPQPAGIVHATFPVLATKITRISSAAWVDSATVMVEPVPPGLVRVESGTVGRATSVDPSQFNVGISAFNSDRRAEFRAGSDDGHANLVSAARFDYGLLLGNFTLCGG